MFVLSAAEMRELDRATIDDVGVPAARLMERAAAAVVELVAERYPKSLAGRIGILCGPGNNGGDGRVAARLLREREVAVVEVTPEEWAGQRTAALSCDLLIDGLFGNGLSRPLEGAAQALVEDVNAHFQGPVVAIDIPSGISADAGATAFWTGAAIRAAATVTFTAPKLGHFLAANAAQVGDLRVADIGTPERLIHSQVRVTTRADAREYLRPRAREAYKGDYGHVLVVGGSTGKSGAAVLAATAALRMGAGLVTAAVPASVLPIVAGARPELMTEPMPETADGRLTAEGAGPVLAYLLRFATVVAAGPGVTRDAPSAELIRELVRAARVPVVLDADGLNAFAGRRQELRFNDGGVLTPHPGEMARLFGVSTAEVQSRRLEYARRLAGETGAVVVLKGHRSLVAAADGAVFINTSGNPGMATGGAGDVLTGMIAGLLGQFPDRSILSTVAAAVYLHGAAGDAGAAVRGERGLVAGDLIESLPAAMRAAQVEVAETGYDIPA